MQDQDSVICGSNIKKRKDKRFDIVLEKEPKRFGIVLEFVLLKTDCFDLV
jgi:hypothetical protein